jgi:signal transduction histidine kinase
MVMLPEVASTKAPAMSTRRLSRDLLVDIGLCGLLVAFTLGPMRGEEASVVAGTVALGAVAIMLVLARRRWPLPAMAVGLAGAVAASATQRDPTVLLPAALILIFNAAVRTDRRTALVVNAAGVVAFLACVIVSEPDNLFGPELLAGLAWPTLAAAAGDATRSRAQVLAAAVERAERAEITRDQEARRRVAEERLHIARELHDLVAHNMAVVNVQAGVAEHFLRTDPDAATTALRHVRTSAQAVLDELAGILSVLRSDDTPDAPDAPTPTIDDVPTLVASFDAAGLAVTYETTGEHRPLAATATVAAYRTVQEALANALKHGDGQTRLRMAYAPDGLHLSVDNHIATTSDDIPGWGYGLIGMRERVTAAGGTITTEDRDGIFHIDAHLPYAAENASDPIVHRDPT